ncbi:CPBP family intramembrane glutamic endopeptidase [Hymenobacter sublimis]|uniref:CPBP family intramembrane metalloprotease n=1 Tax=Hymenobacter sublimis TaxID=2933777 RepID=A0ABY4J8P8_9BACT|nr:CPBP family intramembrane glutamic endopeptidase [Hymenobacter sublimis]UPL49176.1 CPBP family intramembrane metalloprotease [Hymenobacter sublimis]
MKGFVSSRLHPFANLALLLLITVATLCIAGFFTMVFNKLLFGVGMQELGNVAQNPQDHPNGWGVLMLSQGVTLLVMLGGAALGFAAVTGYRWAEYFTPRRPVRVQWLLPAALLIISSLPAMAVLIEWNQGIHFPGFLSGFEQWAQAKELELKKATEFLARLNSTARLLVALVVLAVIPAFSEELFFRGVLQRNLVQWFNSRHVGIWLAAAIFSAIHQQFFGFVPRFVLGLVLGYLYEWSGNILVPMAAHFTQNAFQLLILYAQQRQWSAASFDPDSTESMPWYLVLASLVVGAVLLWYLRERMEGPRAEDEPTHLRTLGSSGVTTRQAAATPTVARTLSHDGVDATRSEG